jgi:hypothetical protein
MKGEHMINLRNGYAIERPDEKNFSLLRYEEVKKQVKDSEGNVVKEENAKGKMVAKTIKEHEWVHKGYYGTLKALLKGMVDHNAHTADVKTLEELVRNTDELIKAVLKEVK